VVHFSVVGRLLRLLLGTSSSSGSDTHARDVPAVFLEVKAEGLVLVCNEARGQLSIFQQHFNQYKELTGHVVGVDLGHHKEDDQGGEDGHARTDPEGTRRLSVSCK